MPAIMIDPTDMQPKPLPPSLTLLDGRTAQGDLDQATGTLAGWLIPQAIPPVAAGFVRTFAIPAWQAAGDGTAAPVYHDDSISDLEAARAAQQAAQEAARQAAQQAAQAIADAAPFAISKVRLLRSLMAVSADTLSAFVGFIDADPTRKLLWDASVTLDSDDPMIQSCLQNLSTMIGGGDPVAFLKACKSELFTQ